MIYLIESIGRDNNDDEVKTFLKIGYSEDKVFKNRLNTYYLHNPHCRLLCTILGGTQEQEKLLHYKFKNYLAYRREWYIDNIGEIIDFFKTHSTIELLNEELGTSDPTYFIKDISGHLTKKFIKVRKTVKKLINTFYAKQLTKENSREITEQFDKALNKYVGEIGKTIFNIEDFKKSFTEGSLEGCSVEIKNDAILNFLEDFEKNDIFREKMRLLCECDLSEEEVSVILDQVPLTYKNYYLSIGPKRCKALNYSKNLIEKEFNSLFVSQESIEEKIYQVFKVNDIYTKKFIKEKLGEIYSDLGYSKAPKAIDIEKYFETRRSRIKKQEALKLITVKK